MIEDDRDFVEWCRKGASWALLSDEDQERLLAITGTHDGTSVVSVYGFTMLEACDLATLRLDLRAANARIAELEAQIADALAGHGHSNTQAVIATLKAKAESAERELAALKAGVDAVNALKVHGVSLIGPLHGAGLSDGFKHAKEVMNAAIETERKKQ